MIWTTRKKWIALDEISVADQPAAGNKAVNLSLLMKAGFCVPMGIVITTAGTEHYQSLRGEKDRRAFLEGILRSAGGIDFPLIVRSSAVGEDSRGKTYAGILKSFPNICKTDDLVAAVDGVIASANSKVAREYGGRKDALPVAVIFQEFIEADCSGVLFSVHPVSGDRAQAVLEYFNGLGDGVVGGENTPNHVVLCKGDGSVLFAQPSPGGVAVRAYRDHSGTYCEVVEGSDVIHLSRAVMNELVVLGDSIEKAFSCPVDVEWAMKSDKLHIVQARPATAWRGLTCERE